MNLKDSKINYENEKIREGEVKRRNKKYFQ